MTLPAAAGDSRSSNCEAPLDFQAQAARLKEAFQQPKAASSADRKKRGALSVSNPIVVRAAKIALGLAVIAICGIAPAQRLFQDASIDAITNARLLTVRAPIDGVVEPKLFNSALGNAATANETLLTIHNPMAGRGRLDDLTRDLRAAEARRDGLSARLASLKQLHTRLVEQVGEFRLARGIQLRANIRDLQAQLQSSYATKVQLERDLARAQALARTGAQSQVMLEHATRDTSIAIATSASLQQRLTSAKAEADALDKGFFVGDAYNDRPSSSQQADDVAVRIAETHAELGAVDAGLKSLRNDIGDEQRLQALQTNATVVAPEEGRIWDVLVAPGEQVSRGQDLLRILDCSTGLVTATVRESVFGRLKVGQSARFSASGVDQPYTGSIVRLAPASNRSDNLAARMPIDGTYQVTVAMPGLNGEGCRVGRPGRLIFSSGNAGR